MASRQTSKLRAGEDFAQKSGGRFIATPGGPRARCFCHIAQNWDTVHKPFAGKEANDGAGAADVNSLVTNSPSHREATGSER